MICIFFGEDSGATSLSFSSSSLLLKITRSCLKEHSTCYTETSLLYSKKKKKELKKSLSVILTDNGEVDVTQDICFCGL